MYQSYVQVSNIQTENDKEALEKRLSSMIGVLDVQIDINQQCVNLEYETPANLNSLEKEIYDAGFPVINSFKGGH
ncbi:heavy-metal-associated domain-containing protein [Staphylococcus felis]|uniref:Heavy-metal-associated domain-containing protein n=1 Tax=Staphylococcus felis TaxID=46127 RepID=A0AAX1RTD4_9STAP|nr:heavy-metal-associated domain-containing protein [Staphylococcus felis]REH76458.1 heavy-metal-associated domain-containing protein [Staphylococcus felis]REH80922.1 heavy-metal-associated domain-containing protein [Staphylococcus felis]REH86817.1 heavy-metal-associated domain-containing protein [Staphylococcus felis]REH90772.1 heavy-metal-associated domain-containing protein [Staphylococcus felis]REH98642.1 heavy-metal-associated domain-containing protein [Staphylococcus felis]